ncbi:hypothetical protein CDD80_5747 [Ophiocordyceps camponoti-rufipedis]|uniref:Zeta toxin domain-containing protein n=1 Tax=Ophiocordyceps camponoti-rufipedis TaxID=2004952 RepID=A0A2C5ZGM6_9HYPO|nr:hypothetical protein CDD80_5747 [Ophiocordyceps camponoti-rufipedis]
MPPNHRLPPQASTNIFTTLILPSELPPPQTPLPTPTAILLTGQTGSGKSTLSPPLLSALSRGCGSATHLIADTFKTYHPEYARLAAESSARASAATGPDARRWLAMAVGEVVRRRAHLVVESACRHFEDWEEMVRVLRGGGYRLVVVLLAVPAGLSRLGIAVRFYLPGPDSSVLDARLTPAAVHDESYGGVAQAAAFLDANPGLADRILLVRRGGLVASVGEGGLLAALTGEREGLLTGEEKSRARRDLERLAGCEGAEVLCETLKELLRPFLDGGERGGAGLMPLVVVDDEAGDGDNVLRL